MKFETKQPSYTDVALDKAPIKHTYQRTTYSRKPPVQTAPTDSSSGLSSLPSSPVAGIFDTPMRLYGKPSRQAGDASDAADTTYNTDVSPEQKEAHKFTQSQASSQSDHEGESNGASELPVYGAAKAILDESDHDAEEEDDDDQVILARIRAQAKAVQPPSSQSDLFEGSLSSAPPESSQRLTSSNEDSQSQQPSRPTHRTVIGLSSSDAAPSGDGPGSDTVGERTFRIAATSLSSPPSDTDDDDYEDMPVKTRIKRLGAKVSAMKGRGGKKVEAAASDSEEEIRKHKRRTFKLTSSSTFDEASQPEPISRKAKMDALAAAKTKSRPQPEADADLGDEANLSRPKSRSRSLSIDDVADLHLDFDGPKHTTKGLELVEEDSDLDLGMGSPAPRPKTKKRSLKPKKDDTNKVKPLTKKDLEAMNRETARMNREHRVRIVPTAKKQFHITDLLDIINKKDQSANASRKQNGEEKSQHTSDPIESDPIGERSSLASSPLVQTGSGSRQLLPLQRRQGVDALQFKQVSSDNPHSSKSDDDQDDIAFPDAKEMVAESEKKQKWDEHMKKKKLLAKSAAPSHKGKAHELDNEHTAGNDDEEDDIEIVGWNAKDTTDTKQHLSPTTPGRKQPTDLMYRELNIKIPGRRRGANAFGSPDASSPNGIYDEKDLVTDSQLKEAGKAFALASDKAAGKLPTPSSAKKRRPHKHHDGKLMNKDQLNAALMHKMQTQNLQAREAKAKKFGGVKFESQELEQPQDGEDLQSMIERLKANSGGDHDPIQDQDDENDPAYVLPEAQNAEEAIGSESEEEEIQGSGSEEEKEADENLDEPLDIGSGSEMGDPNQHHEDSDSEKENAPPSSSQASQRRSHVVLDEEDDAPGPRNVARRRRRTAAFDDEEEEDGIQDADSDGENRLQPGRVVAPAPAPIRSTNSSQERVALADISSEAIGLQHVDDDQQDSYVHDLEPVFAIPDQPEDDSYRTDDVSSLDAGGFSQFFAPTPVTTHMHQPAKQADFWDQTQTQPSQTQKQRTHGNLERGESANSALGAFFSETQSQPGGESLDIFENKQNKDGMAKGFTQFFAEGTPQSQADRFSMPPPKSTAGFDGFSALRKAQMGGAFMPTPSLLPTLDESQAEREAEAQRETQVVEHKKMYLNRDGFFTQTEQDEGWMDSQSQMATPFKSTAAAVLVKDTPGSAWEEEESDGDSPVPRRTLKRLRRGGSTAAESHDDEEEHSASEDDQLPLAQKPNAFDILRAGIHAQKFPSPPKKRKSAYVEGEAEESEDEDQGGKGKRSGLGGVFSDEEKGNGSDEDSSDDDGADLESLVDDEKEEDEAMKDVEAQRRYQQDVQAQEEADLKLHMAAAGGKLRHRRGKGRGTGLDHLLDEDAEEEYLRRKVEMGPSFKKRKLLDGEVDGMDALAANEESMAFVQEYQMGHKPDDEGEYGFLQEEKQDSEEEDEDERVTRRDIIKELAEKRRQRKSGKFSDDEEEVDSETERLNSALRDHIIEKKVQEKRKSLGTTTRRVYSRPAQPEAPSASDDDDSDDDTIAKLLEHRSAPAPRSGINDEDAEPEWGVDTTFSRTTNSGIKRKPLSATNSVQVKKGRTSQFDSLLMQKKLMSRQDQFSR